MALWSGVDSPGSSQCLTGQSRTFKQGSKWGRKSQRLLDRLKTLPKRNLQFRRK